MLASAAAASAVAAPAVVIATALTSPSPGLMSAAALVLAALVCRLVFSAAAVVLRRLAFSRLPLDDQLPAEVWAGVLAVPVATAFASGLAGGGVSLWALTVGPQAPLTGAYRLTAMCALLASATIAAGIPTVAGYRIALQRRGEQEVLFDPFGSPAAARRELAHRRAALRSRRRMLLRGLRERLLASAEAPTSGSGNTGRRRPPAVPVRVRVAVTACAGGVAFATALLVWPPSASALGSHGQLVASVGVTVGLTVLAVAVDIYRIVLNELSEAAVLSRADAVLHGRVAATRNRAARRRRRAAPPARPSGHLAGRSHSPFV